MMAAPIGDITGTNLIPNNNAFSIFLSVARKPKKYWLCFRVSLFMMVLSLAACSPSEFESADELQLFLKSPENNLSYHTQHNNMTISLTYKPTDLMVYQELGDSPANYTQLNNLQRKYESYYFFILNFSHTATNSHAAGSFFEKVKKLSYNLHEYVNLTTSTDTIFVGEFAPIRTIPSDRESDIIIVFKRDKSKGHEWVQFNLNEFGLGVGNQQFKFRVDDLEKIPRLKFAIVS
ncbi:hypothetical protein [Pseudochryseolinea flava]|uniref:Uncharacterized protein n=1 Tax=Pseudochryseolinea flava TaxID=2059302 RepID=A0A364Y3Q1_9BACT|nr:hypothetical protein [Pseudochryseolinea flava]RAW00964.1 hypothetical protein DQQ10_12040 [Pseudochryseolinea flava]